MALSDPKRDTAVFGPRQWYFSEYNSHQFTTQEDAEAARRLAGEMCLARQREMEAEVRAALDRVF